MNTKSETDAANIIWCQTQHMMVKEGGTWAVPRSGLIFKRNAKGFELINNMPFLSEMAQALQHEPKMDIPKTPEELLGYQREDFRCIQRHFKAAKMEVTDPSNLMEEHENNQTK
jgi:hypothetical protein